MLISAKPESLSVVIVWLCLFARAWTSDINLNSEPARHLSKHQNHFFTWNDVIQVSKNIKKRQTLEALLIELENQPWTNNINFSIPITSFPYGNNLTYNWYFSSPRVLFIPDDDIRVENVWIIYNF